MTYDAQGRLAQVSRDGGAEPVSLELRRRAGEVFVTDATGAITRTSSTRSGQVLAVRDPLDRSARLEYDAAGRLDRVTLPLDTISLFDFDSGGDPTHLVKPDGHSPASLTTSPSASRPRSATNAATSSSIGSTTSAT